MSLERFEHGAVVAGMEETAQSVARKMRDFHVGSVVVTRGAHPIGIITDRDLAIRVVAQGLDPSTTKVSEVVTHDPTTLSRDASIETAVRTMRARGVRRLPIVTDDGRIMGIVTADDLTVLLTQELAALGESVEASVDSDESR